MFAKLREIDDDVNDAFDAALLRMAGGNRLLAHAMLAAAMAAAMAVLLPEKLALLLLAHIAVLSVQAVAFLGASAFRRGPEILGEDARRRGAHATFVLFGVLCAANGVATLAGVHAPTLKAGVDGVGIAVTAAGALVLLLARSLAATAVRWNERGLRAERARKNARAARLSPGGEAA